MISKNRVVLAALSVGLVTSLSMGAAQADPTGGGLPRPLNGVGSDTTTFMMNAVSNNVQISGVKQIASWDATGGATFNTGASGCGSVARPNGSGAGRTALLNSLVAGDGCLQFARSSSLTLTASTPSLTYVPVAIDDVDYALTSTSVVPKALSAAQLHSIYTCDPNFVGPGSAANPSAYTITPVLPQAGSGTRSFWETYVGITDANVNANVYPCIINGTRNGTLIEEQSGTALDDKSLIPFSVGQYDAEFEGIIPDKRGSSILGTIDGSLPVQTPATYANQREVYNVIPTSDLNVAPWKAVFVGGGSLVCADTADIVKYGFLADAQCGTTGNQS